MAVERGGRYGRKRYITTPVSPPPPLLAPRLPHPHPIFTGLANWSKQQLTI